MTVTAIATTEIYELDGLADSFAIPFTNAGDGSDIIVSHTSDTGTTVTLALTTDYTIAGDAQAGYTVETNSVLSAGGKLAIEPNFPATQPTPFRDNTRFPARQTGDMGDRLARAIQTLKVQIDRATKVPPTESAPMDFGSDAVRANWVPSFDEDGQIEYLIRAADLLEIADNLALILLVGASIDNVDELAGIAAEVVVLAGIAQDIDDLGGHAAAIGALNAIRAELLAIYAKLNKLDVIGTDLLDEASKIDAVGSDILLGPENSNILQALGAATDAQTARDAARAMARRIPILSLRDQLLWTSDDNGGSEDDVNTTTATFETGDPEGPFAYFGAGAHPDTIGPKYLTRIDPDREYLAVAAIDCSDLGESEDDPVVDVVVDVLDKNYTLISTMTLTQLTFTETEVRQLAEVRISGANIAPASAKVFSQEGAVWARIRPDGNPVSTDGIFRAFAMGIDDVTPLHAAEQVTSAEGMALGPTAGAVFTEDDTVGEALVRLDGDRQTAIAGVIALETEAALSIASGSVTPTRRRHTIDTEGDASSDTLTDVDLTNFSPGDKIELRLESAARPITVATTGNISTLSGRSLELKSTEKVLVLTVNAAGTGVNAFLMQFSRSCPVVRASEWGIIAGAADAQAFVNFNSGSRHMIDEPMAGYTAVADLALLSGLGITIPNGSHIEGMAGAWWNFEPLVDHNHMLIMPGGEDIVLENLYLDGQGATTNLIGMSNADRVQISGGILKNLRAGWRFLDRLGGGRAITGQNQMKDIRISRVHFDNAFQALDFTGLLTSGDADHGSHNIIASDCTGAYIENIATALGKSEKVTVPDDDVVDARAPLLVSNFRGVNCGLSGYYRNTSTGVNEKYWDGASFTRRNSAGNNWPFISIYRSGTSAYDTSQSPKGGWEDHKHTEDVIYDATADEWDGTTDETVDSGTLGEYTTSYDIGDRVKVTNDGTLSVLFYASRDAAMDVLGGEVINDPGYGQIGGLYGGHSTGNEQKGFRFVGSTKYGLWLSEPGHYWSIAAQTDDIRAVKSSYQAVIDGTVKRAVHVDLGENGVFPRGIEVDFTLDPAGLYAGPTGLINGLATVDGINAPRSFIKLRNRTKRSVSIEGDWDNIWSCNGMPDPDFASDPDIDDIAKVFAGMVKFVSNDKQGGVIIGRANGSADGYVRIWASGNQASMGLIQRLILPEDGSSITLTDTDGTQRKLDLEGGVLRLDETPYVPPVAGGISYGTPTALQVNSSGEITVTGPGLYTVDWEGGTTEYDVITILGGNGGDIVELRALSSSRDITFRDVSTASSDNIVTPLTTSGAGEIVNGAGSGGDVVLRNARDRIIFEKQGSEWVCIGLWRNQV